MSWGEIIGNMAGMCTTFSFLPQVIAVWRSGNTDGISRPMYIIFCVGVLFWLVYGIHLQALPMIIFNAITLLLAGGVLVRLFMGSK